MSVFVVWQLLSWSCHVKSESATSCLQPFDIVGRMLHRTQDMAGDPFGLLLRQRIIFLGGEVRHISPWACTSRLQLAACKLYTELNHTELQVNDFVADAVVSQLLMLDATDPTKVTSDSYMHDGHRMTSACWQAQTL